MSEERRLVGVDLGIASDHTVRVLRGDGSEVARRRARPTVESLAAVEAAALAGAGPGTRLEVVMEPTGPAWLPVAVSSPAAALPSTGSPAPRGRGVSRKPCKPRVDQDRPL